MRKKPILATIAMLLASLPALSQLHLHRLSVNVKLASDHIVVTDVFDITPGGTDECYVALDGRYLTKKPILNVTTLSGGYFEKKEWWNSHSPSTEKQGRCARMWKDDIHARIYWGLYPEKRMTYFVSYPLQHLMYSDGKHDVLDFDFVNLSGQTPADSLEIKLYLNDNKKLSATDIDMEGSKTDGEIRLEDGKLLITPSKGSGAVSSMPLHLTFRNGLFAGLPARGPQDNEPGGMTLPHPNSATTIIPEEELHTPLMGESTPVTERAPFFLIEFICDYPKTCIFALCLLVIAGCFAYRKIKAMML